MTAQEIRKDRILGNFKKRGLERAREPKKESARERRDGMSERHLALIRVLPCCVCHKVAPSDPHHLKTGTGERGMGLRSTDKWTVPLCRGDHDDVESVGSRNEIRWFQMHGVDDPLALAEALWSATGDLPTMLKIVQAHRLGAPAKTVQPAVPPVVPPVVPAKEA